jgi:ribonucleotide reductase beta subunit family protein with ferritin-like domain
MQHLENDIDDYTFLPIKRPQLIQYFYDQCNIHWGPHDIDFRDDRNSFDKCDENMRTFVKGILSFFVFSDGLVIKNISQNFQEDTSFWKECSFFYCAQNFMETIHSQTYSIMADVLCGRNHQELQDIFDAFRKSPAVAKIAEFMEKYMDRNLYTLPERIIAFCCVEGILFTSAFASVYWIKGKKILEGFCKANEFIARDEALHTRFGVTLYAMICTREDFKIVEPSRVYEIINEAVLANQLFVEQIIHSELIGLNSGDLVNYTKCTADALLVSLGYNKLYNVTNPLDWMSVIALPNKSNFFENRVSEYTRNTTGEITFNDDVYF